MGAVVWKPSWRRNNVIAATTSYWRCVPTLNPSTLQHSPGGPRQHTSRRCLIFVKDRVFFQCRQSVMCEDIRMEDDASSNEFQTWSLETKDALGRRLSENSVHQYTKCVQLYVKRLLTISEDKLPAFSAIAILLSGSLDTDFSFGLPVSSFDFSLLWTPTKLQSGPPPRRIPEFASWSWAGWDDGASEYLYSTLEGVLVNMHERLTTRSWIDWYVLLIVTDDDGISERVGLGKIFKDAFKRSYQPGDSWKEIILGWGHIQCVTIDHASLYNKAFPKCITLNSKNFVPTNLHF